MQRCGVRTTHPGIAGTLSWAFMALKNKAKTGRSAYTILGYSYHFHIKHQASARWMMIFCTSLVPS